MEAQKESTQKTLKKVRQINLRLTEEEYNLFREKSKSYPSMTYLIVDSVKHFDTRKGKNRIDTMIKFADTVGKMDTELCRIGNNINQISRELHRFNIAGLDLSVLPYGQFLIQIDSAKLLLSDVLRGLRSIHNG